MKYPKIQLGDVEAVWNKLGGPEGVKRFLRDESAHQLDPHSMACWWYNVTGKIARVSIPVILLLLVASLGIIAIAAKCPHFRGATACYWFSKTFVGAFVTAIAGAIAGYLHNSVLYKKIHKH